MIATSPPAARGIADAAADPAVIDEDHLARMTLGDRALEREVLEIFVRQTVILLERIAKADPAFAAGAAHTLSGSASGIGATRVAQAAERLEQAARAKASSAEFDGAVEASAAITARLGSVLRDH